MATWYRAGTAAVTNGSAAVVGSSTAWASQIKAGDGITFDAGATWYEVLSVTDNTHLTLATNYAGSTASGVSYAADRRSPRWHEIGDVSVRVAQLLDSFDATTGTYLLKDQNLADLEDAAAGRTALGLGALAVLSAVSASQISDASANGRSLISAANYAAMKTLLAIAQGDVSGLTDALAAKQGLDADLTAIAALTRAKGALIAGGASAWELIAAGTDGYVLTADAASAAGIKWASAPISGTKPNLLINGDFQINQRVFGGGALSAGAYGFDRWKAASGGADLSLSGYTLTLTSGTIEQVVESGLWSATNLASTQVTISVESPSADLTVTFGSTSGTITAGSGRQSVTITTGAGDTGNLSLKVAKASGSGVTFGRVKLELGAAATGWEARPLQIEKLLAYRYFWKSIPYATALTDGVTSDTHTGWFVQTTRIDGQRLWFPVGMRTTPTVDIISSNKVASPPADTWQWFDPAGPTWSNPTSTIFANVTDLGVNIRLFFTSAPAGISQGVAVIIAGGFACDAEL